MTTLLLAGGPVKASINARAQDFKVLDSGSLTQTNDNRLEISTRELRAVLKSITTQKATATFTYLGPTKEVSRLANGQVRHQFGLELAAQDVCNLVYVIWHFDDDDRRIHVSVKLNPGQKTHEECLANGYINNIKSRVSNAHPVVEIGKQHTLSAELDGRELKVTADSVVVWLGTLPEAVLNFKGPVGIRSDNAHVIFDFVAGG